LFGIIRARWAHATFGAKLISVFQDNFARAYIAPGAVILFDPETGARVCVAMRARLRPSELLRPVRRLLMCWREKTHGGWRSWDMGNRPRRTCGQSQVRDVQCIFVWGGHSSGRKSFATGWRASCKCDQTMSSVEEAVADADIVCTVSAAVEPS